MDRVPPEEWGLELKDLLETWYHRDGVRFTDESMHRLQDWLAERQDEAITEGEWTEWFDYRAAMAAGEFDGSQPIDPAIILQQLLVDLDEAVILNPLTRAPLPDEEVAAVYADHGIALSATDAPAETTEKPMVAEPLAYMQATATAPEWPLNLTPDTSALPEAPEPPDEPAKAGELVVNDQGEFSEVPEQVVFPTEPSSAALAIDAALSVAGLKAVSTVASGAARAVGRVFPRLGSLIGKAANAFNDAFNVILRRPSTAKKAAESAASSAEKVAPTTRPRNAHLAGKTHPETGIPFDKDGFPDFSGVAKRTVKINQTGERPLDFAGANKAAGLKETPTGYTWHHHQDGTTMQLVPTKIHKGTGHTGGVALQKRVREGGAE